MGGTAAAHRITVVGAAGVLAVGAVLLAAAAATEATRLWHARDRLGFADLVLVCMLGLLAGITAWLAVAFALALVALCCRSLPRAARIASAASPWLWSVVGRSLVGGAVGAATLAGPAGTLPALAAVPHGAPDPTGPGCLPVGPSSGTGGPPLPIPDRPVAGITSTTPTVTVRAGDTLWAIAARHLPPAADDSTVASAWPRWFRTNRDLLGPDPDLIHPRTRLVVPRRFR